MISQTLFIHCPLFLKPPVVTVFFTSNMSQTDSSEELRATEKSLGQNNNNKSINGIAGRNLENGGENQELEISKKPASEVVIKAKERASIDQGSNATIQVGSSGNLRTTGRSWDLETSGQKSASEDAKIIGKSLGEAEESSETSHTSSVSRGDLGGGEK
jgi:hypothetical protein